MTIFDAAKKIGKRRRRCEKRFWAARVGGTPEACRRAFGVCKVKQSHAEFAMSLGRPVPCEQGAADLWATASSADLRFCSYVLLCLCVWVYAILGLWGCEFVGVWVGVFWVCVHVYLHVCVCLRAVCLCVIMCDCMFVDLWVCSCLFVDVFVWRECV